MNSPFFKSSKNQLAPDTSLDPDENAPTLKMGERPDWSLFRSIDGLQQKAGVPATRLRRLVMKEIADNALDTGTGIDAGQIDDHVIYVAENGPGLGGTPQEIAELFSIRRPMRSSKLLRPPQRARSATVCAWSLARCWRPRDRSPSSPATSASCCARRRTAPPPSSRFPPSIIPPAPASRSNSVRPCRPIPTRSHGSGRPARSHSRARATKASHRPTGTTARPFHDLLLAHGDQPVRNLIAQLEGCSGGKAGEIVAAAGLDRMACASVTRGQAVALLATARAHARPVNPERLGFVGRDAFPEHYYAITRSNVLIGSATPQAEIPFVVEAWARKTAEKGDIRLAMLVNRTPITGEINTYRDNDKDICLFGCGLTHGVPGAPIKGAYDIRVNIITPYCPITSDGKAPNLLPFVRAIGDAIAAAAKKAQRAAPKERRVSQKDVVLDNLDDAIAKASGDGEFRFNERQIFYQLRPIVLEQTGQPLLIGNFKAIITDYENEQGEIAGMYREPRARSITRIAAMTSRSARSQSRTTSARCGPSISSSTWRRKVSPRR